MEESLAIPSISQMAAENIRSIFMAISSRNGEIFQIRSLFKGYFSKNVTLYSQPCWQVKTSPCGLQCWDSGWRRGVSKKGTLKEAFHDNSGFKENLSTLQLFWCFTPLIVSFFLDVVLEMKLSKRHQTFSDSFISQHSWQKHQFWSISRLWLTIPCWGTPLMYGIIYPHSFLHLYMENPTFIDDNGKSFI